MGTLETVENHSFNYSKSTLNYCINSKDFRKEELSTIHSSLNIGQHYFPLLATSAVYESIFRAEPICYIVMNDYKAKLVYVFIIIWISVHCSLVHSKTRNLYLISCWVIGSAVSDQEYIPLLFVPCVSVSLSLGDSIITFVEWCVE